MWNIIHILTLKLPAGLTGRNFVIIGTITTETREESFLAEK